MFLVNAIIDAIQLCHLNLYYSNYRYTPLQAPLSVFLLSVL